MGLAYKNREIDHDMVNKAYVCMKQAEECLHPTLPANAHADDNSNILIGDCDQNHDAT